MKRLFVGNLPYQANETELQQWFADGGVNLESVVILRDRTTGASRGFGFVEVESEDGATQAIHSCNGKSFLGRKLVVNEARPQGDGNRMQSAHTRGDRYRSSGGGY